VRFLPSLPGYAYATQGDDIYVNLYLGSRATLETAQGPVEIAQSTAYPWEGEVTLTITPDRPRAFTLYLRIPGWARNMPVPSDLYRYVDEYKAPATVAVNGAPVDYTLDRGFAVLARRWEPGDTVHLHLPMPVRRVVAHPNLADCAGRVAIERGPLVYCAEWVDNSGALDEHAVPDDAGFAPVWRDDILAGLVALQADLGDRTLTLIPYHLWAHRGVGEMAVWLPRASAAD
jgi:DUF1680 family protein